MECWRRWQNQVGQVADDVVKRLLVSQHSGLQAELIHPVEAYRSDKLDFVNASDQGLIARRHSLFVIPAGLSFRSALGLLALTPYVWWMLGVVLVALGQGLVAVQVLQGLVAVRVLQPVIFWHWFNTQYVNSLYNSVKSQVIQHPTWLHLYWIKMLYLHYVNVHYYV